VRCLFVTHKWGDAAPNTGESVTIPHLIETFDEWGKGKREAIWTDEVFHSGRDNAQEMFTAMAEFRPDVVVFTPIPHGPLVPQNVSPEVMRQLSCPVISVFFDLADPKARELSSQYAEASDLCINIDGDQRPIGTRFLSLWAARTLRPPREKTIDVCFLGARDGYTDRIISLKRLADAGIRVTVSGGRQEQRCSFTEYMETLDRSLIALNFSKTRNGLPQLKARVFEALSSHCCLVEDVNPPTSLYLTPGVDFVVWSEPDELIAVVRQLLSDHERAARIAKTGHHTFETRYSAACFWDKIAGAL
jgi:Glycosyl transferases group 1